MMLDELRHFILIAEHGTFTEAARRAHLTQPALTASIRRLESVAGARLLHRGRHGAALTAAGAAFLPRARAVLADFEDGLRAVRELEGLAHGEVRVGAGATVCTYLLPALLVKLRRAHPGLRFLLREATPDEAFDALASGDLDLAIVSDAARSQQTRFVVEPWRDDELVIVAAPDIDAKRAPFVAFRRGATTRRLLEERVPGADIVMELGSIAAIKGHVKAGIGVALVSRSAVSADVARGSLVVVRHRATPMKRTFSIVHRGLDRLPPAATALRALLLESSGA